MSLHLTCATPVLSWCEARQTGTAVTPDQVLAGMLTDTGAGLTLVGVWTVVVKHMIIIVSVLDRDGQTYDNYSVSPGSLWSNI